MKMNLPDGHRQVDADRKRSRTSEESRDDQQSTEQFRERRHIPKPGRESHSSDHVSEVLQATENLVISVNSHDGAQGEAHYEKCERLKTIEVTQTDPPSGRNRLAHDFASAE